MNRLLPKCVVVFFMAALAFAGTAYAATPASGTLTDTSSPLTYRAGPFYVANPTPVPEVDVGPECSGSTQPCDSYMLTINLSSAYIAAHPNGKVKVSIGWTDAGSGASDYDLYVYKGSVNTTDGSQAPDYQSASSNNPETTFIPVGIANGNYTVKIVPYTPSGETVNATVELVSGAPSGSTPPPPVQGGPGIPRYQIFVPQDGLGSDSQGEFNIGFNPRTGNIMTLSDLTVYRVTPPEKLNPPLPAAAPALWTDVTFPTQSIETLDPILWTDQDTGRTFEALQTTGAEALFAYTDNDGANWTPASAAPPNGGADHETVGTGPYPPGSPFASIAQAAGYPNAVYYCSQGEEPAFCQRSDDGGVSFGPGVPIYNGVTTQCAGLHGHVRVGPDGAAYVPNARCGTNQGGAVSTDAGVTWNEFLIPDSSAGNSFDPSVAVPADHDATDHTVYYCYVNGDGHPRVAVSHDDGQSWSKSVDIGASQGIQNAVFTEATAGDSDRAACGFIGTTTPGNFQSVDFTGVWYLYIATTYNGGQSWTTVNANPGDPVQGQGGICAAGISCSSTPNNRNLLDFDEITHDDKGNVLFGYDDGCVSQTCIASGGKFNDFVADDRVARQTGGKPLFAKYDPNEPTVPKQPYLTGTRDNTAAHLNWYAPDNGGNPITDYKVYRGITSGSETLLADTGNTKTTFADTTADPAVPDYYYTVTALNAEGESVASNEVDLPVGPAPTLQSPCVLPGVTVVSQPPGSQTGAPSNAEDDITAISFAEPYNADTASDPTLVITMHIENLSELPALPPNTEWKTQFTYNNQVYFVSMDTDASNLPSGTPVMPEFSYGVTTSSPTGGTLDNTLGQLPGSGYSAADNTITLVLPTKLIVPPNCSTTGCTAGTGGTPPAAGAQLTGITGTVLLLVGGAGTGLLETVDSTPTGSYTLVGNAFCVPNHPPLAALKASPLSGTVPLEVNFDGSGSSDPDQGDSVASYRFDFGDGSAPVIQSTPTISHTYQSAGDFKASLTVTDTHGAKNQNAAFAVIHVEQCFEDDDSHIAYDKGWHTVNDSNASAGTFHVLKAKHGGQHGLSFAFDLGTNQGTLKYFYATSKKGGSADVYLDGSLVKTISYQGDSGSFHKPVFGSSSDIAVSGQGSHTLELRNVSGAAYVDKFCIADSSSDAQPATGPGNTTTQSSALAPGQQSVESVTIPTTAESVSVVTESTAGVLYTLAVVDPSGNVLSTVNADANGIASVELPVSVAGVYLIRLVNPGIAPIQVWSAVTPQVERDNLPDD